MYADVSSFQPLNIGGWVDKTVYSFNDSPDANFEKVTLFGVCPNLPYLVLSRKTCFCVHFVTPTTLFYNAGMTTTENQYVQRYLVYQYAKCLRLGVRL
jgi:hypothetical protein